MDKRFEVDSKNADSNKKSTRSHNCNYITNRGTKCTRQTVQEYCSYHRVKITTGRTKYFLRKEGVDLQSPLSPIKLGRPITRIYKCQEIKNDGSICGIPTARTLCFLHEYLQRHGLKHNWKKNIDSHDCNYITRKGTKCKKQTFQEYCYSHRILLATGKSKYYHDKEEKKTAR